MHPDLSFIEKGTSLIRLNYCPDLHYALGTFSTFNAMHFIHLFYTGTREAQSKSVVTSHTTWQQTLQNFYRTVCL